MDKGRSVQHSTSRYGVFKGQGHPCAGHGAEGWISFPT